MVHENDNASTSDIDPRMEKLTFTPATDEVIKAVLKVARRHENLGPLRIRPLVRHELGRDVSEGEVNWVLKEHCPHRLCQ